MRSTLVRAGFSSLLLACPRPPDPIATATVTEQPDACPELPEGLGRDMNRPLELSLCVPSLEPPDLDRAARARTIETIRLLGPDDPHGLILASDVASSEFAAANWDGLDDPDVHARLRVIVGLLESLVDSEAFANTSVHRDGIMALVCAHVLLDEPGPARARADELWNDHPGPWMSRLFLVFAEFADEQADAIQFLDRASEFDEGLGYIEYRLAWALRHPQVVDEARAVALLEQIVALPDGYGHPRLDLVLRHRAALELRVLGREAALPDCPR